MPITSNRNLTPWALRPLTTQESALNGGYNYVSTITANDLTSTVTAGAQTYTLATLKAGDVIDGLAFRVKTTFVSSEAGSLLSLVIGQTGTTNLWITATEMDEKGTEVLSGTSDETVSKVYVAASDILVTLTANTGKILNAYTAGQIEIYVKLFRMDTTMKSAAAVVITK